MRVSVCVCCVGDLLPLAPLRRVGSVSVVCLFVSCRAVSTAPLCASGVRGALWIWYARGVLWALWGGAECVCVCVCVFVYERERKKAKK